MSKSLNLIKSIYSLKLMSLSEANMTGKFYTFLQWEINASGKGHLGSRNVTIDGEFLYIVELFSRSYYNNYRKRLSTKSIVTCENNFIYEYSIPTQALNLDDPNELDFAINRGIVIPDDGYYTRDELLKDKYHAISYCNRWLDYPKFKERYKGFVIFGNLYLLLNYEEYIDLHSKLTLVDGNAKRFTSSTDHQENKLPDFVIDNLVNYTDMEKRSLSENTIEWLTNNFKKPYNELTIYRGSGIGLDRIADRTRKYKYDWNNLPLDNLEKYLKKYYGIKHLEDLRIGAPISMIRGKESSWTVTPQTAQNFAYDDSIGIVVKATVPASRVLIDFRLLPKSLLKEKFRFWTQNEVIISAGPIDSIVSTLSICDNRTKEEDRMSTWLANNGYTFKANFGFSKSI